MIVGPEETCLIEIPAFLVIISLNDSFHEGIGIVHTLIYCSPDVIDLAGACIVAAVLQIVGADVPVEITQVIDIGIHEREVIAIELLLAYGAIDSGKAIFHFCLRIVESVGADYLRFHIEETA